MASCLARLTAGLPIPLLPGSQLRGVQVRGLPRTIDVVVLQLSLHLLKIYLYFSNNFLNYFWNKIEPHLQVQLLSQYLAQYERQTDQFSYSKSSRFYFLQIMSSQKAKPKEKKSEAQIDLENKCNELRADHLEKEIRLKRLQEQKNRMGLELFAKNQENAKLRDYISSECGKLNACNKSLMTHVAELSDKKNELEIQLATTAAKLQFQRREHQQDRKERDKEFDDLKRHYLAEISRLEAQAGEYNSAISERHGILTQKNNLLKMLQEERQNYRRELADKDREKIQALDSLKKEMMDKIRSMKSNLLSIRRDQLENNTRLTFLQNHQLLEELEYQSLNTQHIIDRNLQMEKQLKQLHNEVQIREEVQKEIAKRAVFSKKMLQTVHEKYVQLEKEKENAEKLKHAETQNKEEVNTLKNKVTELVKTIETAMHKIQSLEKQLSLKSSEVEQYKKIVKKETKQTEKMAQLFTTYLTNLLQGKGEIENPNQIDIESLRKKNIKDWSSSQIKVVVQAILNNFKNSIVPSHLSTDLWRNISDKKVVKLCPIEQSKVVNEQMSEKLKCTSQYIRNLSIEKSRMLYRGRSLASDKSRSLTKLASENSVSFGKYVQTNVRGWGKEVEQQGRHSHKHLADRFMKPIKFRLR